MLFGCVTFVEMWVAVHAMLEQHSPLHVGADDGRCALITEHIMKHKHMS